MDAQTPQPFVLAGVDGTAADDGIVAWAVREARERGDVLTIAHVRARPQDDEARLRAQAVLDEAVAHARAVAPRVPVHPYLASGSAGDVLLRLSRNAEVTVLGPGSHRHISIGSVAERVVTHAHNPVVLVRGGAGPVRRVGLGLDASPAARDACAFAVDEARLHGARLEVVTSYWRPDSGLEPDDLLGPRYAARRVDAGRLLEDTVRPYADKYPEMQVSAVVTARPPGPVLDDLAAGVDLVVVGSRGLGPVAGFVLGSVSLGLVRHAACTVAVVHAPWPGEGARP